MLALNVGKVYKLKSAAIVALIFIAIFGQSTVNAQLAPTDDTTCNDPNWQPAECGSGTGGISNPFIYTVTGKDPNPGVAYDEAIAEANTICNGYTILNVRFKQLPVQWKAIVTIQCPSNSL